MNILLIDDDPASRERLADFFQKKGYPFFQASNGRISIDIVRQHPINIIIFSQEMWDMDGIELCRIIREKQTGNYTYCIILTKENEKERRLTGYLQGVDSYITNPPDLEELEALVRVGMRITGFITPQPAKNEPEQTQMLSGQNGNAKGVEKKLSMETSPLQIKRKDIRNHDISNYDILFARIALERKLITKELLVKVFSSQKKEKISGNMISIDKIFLEKKMISATKIDYLRSAVKRHFGKKFGNLVLKKGFATQEQVNKALKEQATEFKASQSYRRTGDILVANKVITKEQCDIIRCEMKNVKSFDEKKELIKNSTTPSQESDNKNTGQPGAAIPGAPIEEMIKLVVSENKLEARIRIKKDISGRRTPDAIIGFLNQNNIIFGVKSLEQIAAFLRADANLNADANEEKTFLVAKGKPATLGCDASIEYHFDTDHLKAGAVNEYGNIDFRERGERPRVQLDDLLATKLSMESGKSGIDVNGNPILVPDVNDIQLKCGEGTRLSENGLEVYATIDGQPNLTLAGDLSVFAELIINGDVDFKTGNINFDGNVVVKGAIIDGFTIKCGNLNAKEIFGAKIFAIGDVHVSGGILRTQIKAEGNVTAKFIMNSNIKSFGSVLVDKEVIDSKIRSSGNFIATRGKIISSFISAKMGFESPEIGSDVSHPCRINVGIDENIKKRIQEFNYTITDKRQMLEKIQKNYEKKLKHQETIHLKISELVQIQDPLISEQQSLNDQIEESKQSGVSDGIDRIQAKLLVLKAEADALEDQVNNCFKSQEMLDEKITEGLENIKNIIQEIETISDEKEAIIKWSKEESGIPVIKVKGSISHGTKMFGIYSSIIPKETIRNVFIKEIQQTDVHAEINPGRWEMMILESK